MVEQEDRADLAYDAVDDVIEEQQWKLQQEQNTGEDMWGKPYPYARTTRDVQPLEGQQGQDQGKAPGDNQAAKSSSAAER